MTVCPKLQHTTYRYSRCSVYLGIICAVILEHLNYVDALPFLSFRFDSLSVNTARCNIKGPPISGVGTDYNLLKVAATDYVSFQPRQILSRGPHSTVEKLQHKSDPAKVMVCKTFLHIYNAYSPAGSSYNHTAINMQFDILKALSSENDNIVGYVDLVFDKPNRKLLLYTEFCIGGTLEDFVAKIKAPGEYVSEPFVWKVLEQLASALMHCHSSISTTAAKVTRQIQILHKNIKPGNIFFQQITKGDESNPIVKMGDFLLGPGAWTGKFSYKPPEVTGFSNEWSESCDIFSLGCAIYYLCSLGGPPWDQLSPIEEKAKTQLDDAKKALEKTPYSQNLINTVMVCMSFEPASRPKAPEVYERARYLPRPNITHWAELDWHFYGDNLEDSSGQRVSGGCLEEETGGNLRDEVGPSGGRLPRAWEGS